MTILDHIVAQKYKEVAERKALSPVSVLERANLFRREPVSFKNFLLQENLYGIIAEFKRKSPSRGIMNEFASSGKVCRDYVRAGASAVSVLTDLNFFGGTSDDLINVRESISFPILRKDFIVDEYQIVEAKSIGADAILLIASLHNPQKIQLLHRLAQSLGLEVLIEVHDESDFLKIPADAHLVGINSRNLASLDIDMDRHSALIEMIPKNVVKVAESGIKSASDCVSLRNAGFTGFLIGELFMNSVDPGQSCLRFINELREMTTRENQNKQYQD
jgi:indole-3-glycerol phosphate synthase